MHELQNMYATAENRLNKLFELFYSNNITQAEFSERKEAVLQEKEKAKEHLETHGEAQKAWLNYSEQLLVTTDHVYRIFKEGNPEEVKALMTTLGKDYVLKDTEISFQFKEPFNFIARLHDAKSSNKTVMRGRWDAVRTWFWENFPVEPVTI